MTEGTIPFALAMLLLLNVSTIAYGYGKLTQKVCALGNELSHLTTTITEIAEKLSSIAERLSKLEGRG